MARFRPHSGPSHAGMDFHHFPALVFPCFFWLSGFFGVRGGCDVVFRGGTTPWSGVLPALLYLGTCCRRCHLSAQDAALSPGAEGLTGDTQLSLATRLGVLVGRGQNGGPHGGGELQGFPSQTGSWGAGVGEGDTGAPQHPQSCPGTMPRQRGCSRAGVHPAIVRAGGSRAATPAGPPTTHFWAAGSWAQSQGAAAGGWQHRGQLRSRGRRRGRKRAGKKQKSPRRKPKPAWLQHQPCARGAKELPPELGALWGRSRAGRMRPSDRG